MRRKIGALGAIATLVLGVAVFAAPPVSDAVVINTITVTNGTGGNFTGGAAGTTWVFAPINLAPGQTLVLTQNQNAVNSTLPTGLPGFNFDTSENGGVAAGQYTVSVNGTNFLDNSVSGTAGVLNAGGVDNPASTTINEAANWVRIGGVAGSYDVYVGYADTLHSGACLDGGNCLPNSAGPPAVPNTIWDGTADVFLGHGSSLPGYPVSPHCNVNQANAATADCFDAGAILIVAARSVVPEPSSLLLLGAGLMGVAAYGRKYLKKAA